MCEMDDECETGRLNEQFANGVTGVYSKLCDSRCNEWPGGGGVHL